MVPHVNVVEEALLSIVSRTVGVSGISYHPYCGQGQRHGAISQYHGEPSGVAVGVIVAPVVGTGVAVSAGKGVALGVAVTPGTVAVGTAVSVGVAVIVGVLLGEGVAVGVLVGPLVGLGVAVGGGPTKYHGAM